MLDGFKIFCQAERPEHWECHPDLDFVLPVAAKTGEILPEARMAKFREAVFKLTPSRKDAGVWWAEIRGSLNRYFRHDASAAPADLTFGEVCEAVQDLTHRFDLDPTGTKIQTLEFGVNITLPCSASSFLKYLVCHASEGNYKIFTDLNDDGKRIGSVAVRRRYDLKIYDKGKQAAADADNVLRVEIRIKDMELLKPYGVQTLADLTDPEKISRLGRVLAQSFAGVIFYDGSISADNLTPKERLFLANCRSPVFWEEMTIEQRRYSREKFAALVAKNGANQAYSFALKNLPILWQNLFTASVENSHQREAFPSQNDPEKSGQNDAPNFHDGRQNSHQREVRMKFPLMGIREENNNINASNMTQEVCESYFESKPLFAHTNAAPAAGENKRSFFHIFQPVQCACCGAKIAARRGSVRYCSKPACQNTARAKRRRAAAQIEAAKLDDILQRVASVASVRVYLTDPTDRRAPRRREIIGSVERTAAALLGQPFRGIRSAVLVEVRTESGEVVRLARSYAKKFLRALARTEAAQPAPPTPSAPAPRPASVPTSQHQPTPPTRKPQPPPQPSPARLGEKPLGEIVNHIFSSLKNGSSWSI